MIQTLIKKIFSFKLTKKNSYIFYLLFIFNFLFTPAFAQGSDGIKYKLSTGEQAIGNRGSTSDCATGFFCIKGNNVANFLQSTFNLAVGIAISVAVVLLILNGINGVLSSFGIGDGKGIKVGDDKTAFEQNWYNPIVGLIIVLISVVVVRTLNPDLLEFPIFNNLDLNKGQVDTSKPTEASIN
jgi:hypothetical protein